MMERKAYYPLFADLNGRLCVVVGGGAIAQRKVTTLLSYGARITVVSPTVTNRLATYARQGKIRHMNRRFRPADLKGAWLVYAATNEEAINESVYRSATRARIFTNVVDQKPFCSFIAPAIVKQDDLVIAISTGGASPTIAKQLRRELTRTVGAEYARMIRMLGSLRETARHHLPSYQDRKRYFDRLVQGPVFGRVRRGQVAAARRDALKLLEKQRRQIPISKHQSSNNHQ